MPVILEIKPLFVLLCRMMMTLFLSAEFSQAQNPTSCKLQGGICFYRNCPPFMPRYIGRCRKGDVCCGR
uniref:Beta-defensin-like domain-containing protein n=1 Tax=Chelydra serpentina TaxID=8475 RepID=A0A8C3SG34_CHESE